MGRRHMGWEFFETEEADKYFQSLGSRNPWKEMSAELKDFFKCCLEPKPSKRKSASQLLKNAWVTDNKILIEILRDLEEEAAKKKLDNEMLTWTTDPNDFSWD